MATVQLGSLPASIPEPVAAQNAAAAISISAPGPAASQASAAPTPEALLLIARQVGEGLKAKSAGLDYHVDMVGGMPRIRIIDSQTGQLVRQIPSDEVLSMSQALDRPSGVLFREKI